MGLKSVPIKLGFELRYSLVNTAPGGYRCLTNLSYVSHYLGETFSNGKHLFALHFVMTMVGVKDSLKVILDLSLRLLVMVMVLVKQR